ncbi:nucleotidyltransferase family protein [Microbulbifer celer]|uniref:Nucleotidyltransferase family protein n=1 Tax=Microbulbifer celer TaxID=435905 RepID=A0ABW3U818_9GAMM|nr:nucleotidyltransferase family protein [Microbulbifer celer]UFN58653.1 nucleotidyltransferase family protein [Microbulbifer celer]
MRSESSESVVGLILAAGYSRRFGMQDKRTASFGDTGTLLSETLSRVTECFAHWYVVVREEDDLGALHLPLHTPVIRTCRASLGQGASMADAFAAIGELDGLRNCNAAAVLLGDMPYIQPDTISGLCVYADEQSLLRATYAGRPGHPVIFGRRFWTELTKVTGDRGGLDVICQHPTCYREIPSADAGVCRDIDHLSDFTVAPETQ